MSNRNELLAHFMPGRGRRSGSQRVGIIHAVAPLPEGTVGDNFNKSLCGKMPTGRSLGWVAASGDINCKKCRRKL